MTSPALRKCLTTAVSVLALTLCFAPASHAQEAALGADTELAAKGVWSATTTYAKNDIVTARGSTWISRRANNTNRVPGQTAPSSAAWWQLFARGFNPEGAWQTGTRYQPDDVVTHLGQTYRAKITNISKLPTNTANWELLVTKGAAGADGAQGQQGLQGLQGPQGPAGPNTGITAGTQNAPGISFGSDTTTGIYSPAAGLIAMVEGGASFLHGFGINSVALGRSALAAGVGVNNTAVGYTALAANESGDDNTAIGNAALVTNSLGDNNTALGSHALGDNVTGDDNTAIGYLALTSNIHALRNTAVGSLALMANQNGEDNVAIGYNALAANVTGSRNVAIGLNAGTPVSGTVGGNNILISNRGASGDNARIRIGTQGTQTTTFIAGIVDATIANDAPVLIDTTTGQLGSVQSSRRYKDGIATMPDMAAMLAKLRPVTFHYKKPDSAGAHPLQYGLIAEEVAEVFPDLAVFNKDGAPETVKYQLLPSFLLAGYQAQQKTIAAQAARDEEQQRTITTQAEKIDALEARLRRLEALLPQTKAASLQ